MDQAELHKLKLAQGERRSAAIRAAMADPRIRAKGVQILAQALGKQNAANLYRRKILAVMTRQVEAP